MTVAFFFLFLSGTQWLFSKRMLRYFDVKSISCSDIGTGCDDLFDEER